VAGAGEVRLQRGVQACRRGAGRQQPQVQRHGQHDALAEGPVGRHEEGPLREAGVVLDLGHMLVLQRQAVDLNAARCGARAFVAVDACATLARITRHGVDGQRVVGRQQPASTSGRSRASAPVG
jgi:hypothetical protein